MILNHLRQLTDLSPNMHRSGGVRHRYAIQNRLEAVIRLVFLWHVHDAQSTSIKSLVVLGRAVPFMTEPDHLAPVDVYEDDNKDGEEVRDSNVCVEFVAFDVADLQHTEDVSFPGFDVFEVVQDVDGKRVYCRKF
jgi:hypothetical protein